MSSSKQSKYENTIEKLRNENNWIKLKEVCTSSKDAKHNEYLTKLCLGESELEHYLFFNPLLSDTEANNNYVIDNNLDNAENCFQIVINNCESSEGLFNDANILLCKLYYSKAKYQDAFDVLKRCNLQKKSVTILTKSNQFTLRQLQLYAEAYSLNGLLLEHLKANTEREHRANAKLKKKPSKVEHQQHAIQQQMLNSENEIINCFELASQLAIKHSEQIQQLPKSTTSTSSQQVQQQLIQSAAAANSAASQTQIGSTISALVLLQQQNDDYFELINPLYEIALQKTPVLYMKRGNINTGLTIFRDLLLKKQIQSIVPIRQSLLKKFSDCLLHSVCERNYQPANYKNVTGEKLFKPISLDEECLLCLVLSQYLSSKEVMLLRHPQYQKTRETTLNNAITSLDMLIIYLTYRKCYSILVEKFENMAKYSFEQFYIWYQNGLSLFCAQNYQKAYLVLKECNRMRPDHQTCLLLLAQITLEHLFKDDDTTLYSTNSIYNRSKLVDESIEYSKRAIEVSYNRSAKSFILNGCAYCRKGHLEKQHSTQIECYEKALEAFKKAHEINKYDYLSLYHLAHCYSLLRRINESIDAIQKCLKLKQDDKDALHLLALLLTSTKSYEEAYTVILKACSLHEDYELVFTKSQIEEHLFGYNESITSLATLILLCKKKMQTNENTTYNRKADSTTNNGAGGGGGGIDAVTTSSIESASMANIQNTYRLNEAIGKTISMLIDTDQLVKQQVNVTQTSSLIYQPNTDNKKAMKNFMQLIRILTEICEFYIRHKHLEDAEACLQEIRQLHSLSYLYEYLKGRIYEEKRNYMDAKLCYTKALSINPHHIKSLEHMSNVLVKLNELNLAEKMVRDAIQLNNSLPHLWSQLGRVLDHLADSQAALKCYQTALQLESTNPIVPFSILTKIL